MRWAVAIATAVLLATLTTACQGDEDQPFATPRGLAAAVLTHLGDREVVSVSGSGEEGAVFASVDLQDDDLDVLFVLATDDLVPAEPQCEAGRGTRVVECATEPSFRQVTVGAHGGRDGPVIVGEVQDDERRTVQVQLFGRDTPENRALVAGVLDDELVGVRTSTGLNQAGDDLEDFGPSTMRLE